MPPRISSTVALPGTTLSSAVKAELKMTKVTIYPKDNVQDTVLEKVKQILEGSDKVHPIVTSSRPPVYLSGREISQSEIDELKSLPGIELVTHVEK